MYLWTSRQLLPNLFKIVAHEIPNILEGDDIDYYINSREKRILDPITKFKADINVSIQEFKKLINPIRKIIEVNGFISGKEPRVEDYIFFGHFKWVDIVSSCQLLDTDDPIYKWYRNTFERTNAQIN